MQEELVDVGYFHRTASQRCACSPWEADPSVSTTLIEAVLAEEVVFAATRWVTVPLPCPLLPPVTVTQSASDALLRDRANEQDAWGMVSPWQLQPAIQRTRATNKAERSGTAAFSNCMGIPTHLSPPVRPLPPALLRSRGVGGGVPGGVCVATMVIQLRERYGVQCTPSPFAQAPFRIHSDARPSSVM